MTVSELSDFMSEVVSCLEDNGYDVDRATVRTSGIGVKVNVPEEEEIKYE